MRLWHTELIDVLPREQLVAQWRELSAIAGAIKKNGTPNHLLVNFILEYDWEHFISYAYYVRQEMTKRGYRTMDSVWNKICSIGGSSYAVILPLKKVYAEKMDDVYFNICYYNLFEKYLCGGIDGDVFNQIMNKKMDKYTKKKEMN